MAQKKRTEREQAKERATFAAIQKDIYALGDAMAGLGEVKKDSYCYYTSNTTPWEKGDRYCGVHLLINAHQLDVDTIRTQVMRLQESVQAEGYILHADKGLVSPKLLSADFKVRGAYCFMEADHYSVSDAPAKRNPRADPEEDVFFLDIDCEKPAQAEYYHLVK